MPDYRRKLQDLLIELFQFNDSADLDFGIYAIMNHKAAEITAFIERDLLEAVGSGLQLITDAQRDQAEAAYRDAKAALEAEAGDEFVALDSAGNLTEEALAARGGTMRRLRDAYQNAKAAVDAARQSADLEARVYNDLYRFFARYYDDGDFISQRRYGAAEKYAIPYNGEEVTLYWANYDQYYVKSGETFTDYRFQLPEGISFPPATVAFRLRAASVAQNNTKGDKRFFIVAGDTPVAWDAAARVLTVGFEYRPLTDDEKKWAGSQKQQERLNADAEKRILAAAPDALVAERLAAPEGAKGQERTALIRHLARYTAKNTRDYFIHKNLQRFLERELDFFLKSEVLRIEDLDWTQPGVVRTTAARVETIRLIAGRIIAFLAQIEEFQKRLWEKRKFVVQCDWCVTLDRVPEELYEEIAKNERQVAEWVRLYALEPGNQPGLFGPNGPAGAVEFLRQHQSMMVDTTFFDEDFKGRLLATLADIDGTCDGVLVYGENYQALTVLAPRYAGRAKCIYIDPPYNTGKGDFVYKDSFQHASWLAMMGDRLTLARNMLAESGVIFVSIDDHEDFGLRGLMDSVFGPENFIAQLVWEKGRHNDAKLFSLGHEYMNAYAQSTATLRSLGTVWREPKPGAQDIWKKYLELREQYGENDKAIERGLQDWYRGLPKDHPAKALSRYKHVDRFGPWRDRDISWPGGGGPRYDVINPKTGKACTVPEAGWRFATPEAMARQIRLGLVEFRDDPPEPPFRKAHLHPIPDELDEENGAFTDEEEEEASVGMQVMPSVLYKQSQVAVKYLRNLMGVKAFDNPKDHELLARIISYTTVSDRHDLVVDFFAGSGTTAQAVLASNLRDEGDRRYLLVEMGDHFETLLKPRIQRVIYAADWRDGKPVAGSPGQSQVFQYIRLESYEDALNNVEFRDFEQKEPGLLDTLHAMPDYVLHYMLDYETAGSPSLLDLARFDHPFDYRLNITRSEVTAPHPVDLVTTFNFLIGLRVRTYRRFSRDGRPVVRVTGEDPRGRRVCILWRDVPPIEDMEAERAWLDQHALQGIARDLLYVNGECALPDALPIEPEFQRLMFEPATGTGG